MLPATTILILGAILTHTDGEFILHTERVTWLEAQRVCAEDGGTLLSQYIHEEIIELMANTTDSVWQGRYYTPWVWVQGCYTYYSSISGTEFKNNQMKVCQNHCIHSNYFGLRGKKCVCLDNVEGTYVKTADYCKYICPGNTTERCGGDSAITVYMNDICYQTSVTWQGTVSKSWSGKECLPWANVTEVKDTKALFPDGSIEKASNYCRDPYNLSYVWCYVGQEGRQQCGVPPCIATDSEAEFKCMSFKKSSYDKYQFIQESCEADNYAICTTGNNIYGFHTFGNWQHAKDESIYHEETNFLGGVTAECYSLAGPRIFLLANKSQVGFFHWFGYYRDIATVGSTVPNRKPSRCFSLTEEGGIVYSKLEQCDNKNAFICEFVPVICGETFNSTFNGSIETPDYNSSQGYGPSQRCVWTIHAPERYALSLTVNVSLEDSFMCGHDFLKIVEDRYDNAVVLCGEKFMTMNITGGNVTVEFRSDETVSGRGAQVTWSAVPIATSPHPSPSTRSAIAEIATTQAPSSDMNNEKEDLNEEAYNEDFPLAGGGIAGIIAGAVVCICLVIGVVVILTRRKNPKNHANTGQTNPDLNDGDANRVSRIRDDAKEETNERPVSEIYQNTVYAAECEADYAQYDYSSNIVRDNVRDKDVTLKNRGVAYHEMDGRNKCLPMSEDASSEYNTLNGTTENRYQNRTENVYNHFNDSNGVYDNTGRSNAEISAASDMQTYDHLSDDKDTYDHTSR